MSLFTETDSGLKPLKEQPFKSERDLQKIVEDNLQHVFGLKLVTSEFAPQGDLRIDTLAFDPEQTSFVIIEYKKGGSWSVVDQGFAYLALMLNNKAEFVLKCNECCKENRSLKDVNWEASRILFVAPTFNAYQHEALGFQDLPIELWEIRQYEGNLLSLTQLKISKRQAKLAEVQTGETTDVQRVRREVRTYAIDDHFKEGWEESRELFDALLPQLLSLDNRLQVRPVQQYIGLHIDGKNVFLPHIYKSKIELQFSRTQPDDLNDPEHRLQYVKGSKKYWNQHVSSFCLRNEEDIPYALKLAKQVLENY